VNKPGKTKKADLISGVEGISSDFASPTLIE
jgi:hypothetical protein